MCKELASSESVNGRSLTDILDDIASGRHEDPVQHLSDTFQRLNGIDMLQKARAAQYREENPQDEKEQPHEST